MIDPHLSGADHDQPDLATEPTRSNSAVRTRLHSRSYRASKRLPAWMGSIRFRLTAGWSVLVFGLAALVVGGIYLGLHNSLNNQKISATAFQVGGITFIQPDQAQLVQRSVNERALDALRVRCFSRVWLSAGS